MADQGAQGQTADQEEAGRRRWSAGKIALVVFGSLLVLFLLIQFLPLGRDHSAPPVTAEPAWPSLETKTLARRACFDCHSNETNWPWYSNIVPISLWVSRDVDEARQALNFSEWDRAQPEFGDVEEAVGEGSMPPAYYEWFHSDAKLTAQEQQHLLSALEQIWAADPPTTD